MNAGADPRRAAGRRAEDAACGFLLAAGLTLVGRNVRAGGGEIDLVLRDGGTLVFVEVRYREDEAFGGPEETVDGRKRARIVRAARAYLSEVPPASWKEARFDVVAATGDPERPSLRHFPGAFDAKGKAL